MSNEYSEFDKTLKAVERAYRTLPDKAGTVAVNFFKNRFREQNWIDNHTEPWKRRKRRGKKDSGRAVLTKTGRLRRSIRKGTLTPDYVVIETDVPYARAHNEGFRGTVNVRVHKRSRTGMVNKGKHGTGIYSVKTRKERMRTLRVREVTNTHWVQSHTRRMNIPRRRFMGPSTYLNRNITRMATAQFVKALKTR